MHVPCMGGGGERVGIGGHLAYAPALEKGVGGRG